eukprot:TRINITY_DN13320_c0_g6_i1.p1 TRINITY_DN13320_c0_g6~~TRINITY_DN13320_c0_g6_i1.p1  ORF type:complete len:598 (+),score=99.65 TRINITY_DN13320_c0_g6_i1:76-1794(+)
MIDYREDVFGQIIFQSRGSLFCRSFPFALLSAVLAVGLLIAEDYNLMLSVHIGYHDLDKGQLYTALSSMLVGLLALRSNRALTRFWEGTGLLHMMRGEWFDSVSCCVTFSRGAADSMPAEVKNFRHVLVRMMSICHGSALEEIATGECVLRTIDALGLDNRTLSHLQKCEHVYMFNRVEVLLHMIQSLITQSLNDGILAIPPPILSRVYQTLSRGFVNLLNAKKLADTKFPFPYAQLITLLLLIQVVVTPLVIVSVVKSKILAFLFTFIPLFVFFIVNFVAVEIENPYGTDANDLPLCQFQNEMNKCLLLLLAEDADIVPALSIERCVLDFHDLMATCIDDDAAAFVPARVAFKASENLEEATSPRCGQSTENPVAFQVQGAHVQHIFSNETEVQCGRDPAASNCCQEKFDAGVEASSLTERSADSCGTHTTSLLSSTGRGVDIGNEQTTDVGACLMTEGHNHSASSSDVPCGPLNGGAHTSGGTGESEDACGGAFPVLKLVAREPHQSGVGWRSDPSSRKLSDGDVGRAANDAKPTAKKMSPLGLGLRTLPSLPGPSQSLKNRAQPSTQHS